MYLQQMLCFVAPCMHAQADDDLPALTPALKDMFEGLGYVHFASFSLLPPAPGDARPSLVMELAVDDGIDPERAISDVVDAAAAVLWPFYMSAPVPATLEAARVGLRSLLRPLARHARPAGGFIGMRDRTVAQIKAENAYFMQARKDMLRLRACARARGGTAQPAELVRQLIVRLAGHPDHVAMQTPVPTSFWCEPRPAPLQLLMALIWAVLPVPALLCAIGALGLLADALTPWLLPVDSGLFALVVVAALGFLFAVVLVWTLMTRGGLSMLVAFSLFSVGGIVMFYAVLVFDYLAVATTRPTRAWLELPVSVDLAALAAFVVAVLLAQRLGGNRGMRAMVWVASFIGAAASVLMLGATALGDVALPAPVSWEALSYVVPAVVIVAALLRSAIVRWTLSAGLALMLLLFAVVPLVFGAIPQERLCEALHVGLFKTELIYFALGLLAIIGLPLVMGVAVTLLALLGLGAPRPALGLPLAALLALGVAAGMLLGRWGDGLFHMLHPNLAPGVPNTLPVYALVTGVLAVAGLSFWMLRWAAMSLVPAILRGEDRLDRPDPHGGGDIRPCILHRAILDNEASLAGGPSHMISLTDFKGGGAWQWRLSWFFLHVVGQIGHAWFTKGLLATAGGIKFGHWHIIDDGRRLLFMSNFDGDFGGYLDQFILGASEGINLIWRWTTLNVRPGATLTQPGVPFRRGFPPTSNLGFKGCRYEQRFKAYARASMVPHLFLYQAYPFSNDDIQRATRLRAALLGERTTDKDDQVMRVLES